MTASNGVARHDGGVESDTLVRSFDEPVWLLQRLSAAFLLDVRVGLEWQAVRQ